MKALNIGLLFLFSVIFCVQCEKYDVVYEISEERFVFDVGDTLRYVGSNGSVDTFYVAAYRFWVSTGTWVSPNWFGGYIKTSYKIDHCEVLIESLNDSSKIHLGTQCDLRPWYRLKYEGDESETISSLKSQCEEDPFYEEQYPFLKMTDKTFHSIKFFDVYFLELFGQPYKVYWNLKYGIIRFEGIDEASGIFWDLDDRLIDSQ